MKRTILLLFATVIAFSSCENLEDNSPALQGQIDSIFFKANDVRGQQNDDGTFTVQGINQDQTVTITIAESELGTYPLGAGRRSSATYVDGNENEYSTAPYGEGVIELTDRCISCGWLTGSFHFVARRSEFDSLPVTMQKGVFFEVSFLGDIQQGTPPIGTMTAEVDNVPFTASAITVDEANGTIKIIGFDGLQEIEIQVPSNSVSGNYFLPMEGFAASYTANGETTQAEDGGLVSVNFNNTDLRKILIFFDFMAAGKHITIGRTGVDY